MPPEALEEAHGWLIKANRDLQAAKYLATAEVPLMDVIVYHCQQAMEKALKGYLTANDIAFARTHALSPLVEQASDLDEDFQNLLDHAETLSPFATRFRYPGDLLEPEEGEAEEALRMATEAIDFVLDRLPNEIHPAPDSRAEGTNDGGPGIHSGAR